MLASSIRILSLIIHYWEEWGQIRITLPDPRMLTLSFRGALAGSLISFGSAPFELVKVWLSLHVIGSPTVLMTLAPIVSPPCYNDSRSDVNLSTRSLPPRDFASPDLPVPLELSETS
jgi:hypothetical protein